MDSWEDEESAKPATKGLALRENQWEGEDEDEDVIESWDQPEPDPEPEKLEEPLPAPTVKKVVKKKPKALEEEQDDERELTAEEKLAEKLRRQKLQEESDLGLARDMFGVVASLDTKEEFDRFREEIDRRLADATRNANYTQFAEDLVQTLCLSLSSTDIKRIHNVVGNLHIEKLKMEKGDKGKKKFKIKAKLKVDDETDYNEYSAYTEDFGDFM